MDQALPFCHRCASGRQVWSQQTHPERWFNTKWIVKPFRRRRSKARTTTSCGVRDNPKIRISIRSFTATAFSTFDAQRRSRVFYAVPTAVVHRGPQSTKRQPEPNVTILFRFQGIHAIAAANANTFTIRLPGLLSCCTPRLTV